MSSWAVVIPVKSFGSAKSRLAGSTPLGLDGLAQALAYDSIQVALAAPAVASCLVVCDRGTTSWAESCGADVVVEEPGLGLNAALRVGRDAALEQGHRSVAFMMADLPLVSAGQLEVLLHQVPSDRPAVVSDATGQGTTLLLSRNGEQLEPRFGVGSFAAHRLVAADLSERCDPGLRFDLDTWEDLARLDRPAGIRTREWFDTRLGAGISCPFPPRREPLAAAGADFSASALPV